LIAASVSTSCGAKADPDANCAPVDAAAFCATVADTLCSRQAECFGSPDYQLQRCKSDWLAQCSPKVASVTRSATAFDGKRAGCSIEALAAAPCGESFIPLEKSNSAFTGLGAKDAACTADWECGPDFYCAIDAKCPGHCVARARLGESCVKGLPCLASLACAGGVCVGYAKVGEACAAAPCDENGTCSLGACTARHEDGGACWTFVDCRVGHFCMHDRLCGLPRALGESCGDNDCAAGLYCERASRTCVPRQPVGASCTFDPFDEYTTVSMCESRSACEPVTGGAACGAYRGDGAWCDPSSNRCAPTLYCGKDDYVCHPIKPAGAPCTSVIECGAECDGVCRGTRVCPSGR